MSKEKKTCQFLDKCAFFRKYKQHLGGAYHGFVSMYCRGPKLEECKRRQFRLEKGVPPSDEMLPNGKTFEAA